MTDSGQFYSFINQVLTPSAASPDAILAVADSWLVEDGRVRSLQAHFDRFASSIDDEVLLQQLPNFFSQTTALLPRTGRWFPRIEVHAFQTGGAKLHFRLRTAPDQESQVSLWTHPEPDPRTNPLVKGPDLSLAMQLRRAAQMHGADEAVILNAEGFIAEGALTSIVWWRDDVLCAPGNDIDWLPSITRIEVFEIAEQMGLTTRTEKAKPADLVGLEVWVINSLQGIRVVDHWVGLGAPLGAARRLEAFNKRMRLLATAID